MRILLVAATLTEIGPLSETLGKADETSEGLKTYTKGDLTLEVMITGVGMVATAYQMGRRLSQRRFDLAINAGIAGTFDPGYPVGTVCNVTTDEIPDFGAENGDQFLSVFSLGLRKPDDYPFRGGKLTGTPLSLLPDSVARLAGTIPGVAGITSNTAHGNRHSIEMLKNRTMGVTESMEGAAFYYACLSSHIPCIQIRAISNLVEERDISNWNIPLAIRNLNDFLKQMIVEINQ